MAYFAIMPRDFSRGFIISPPFFGVNMDKKTEFFTAKRVAILGMMTAVAYLLTLLSFPIFPMAPFLMLDFSFSIMLLAGYMLGPLSSLIIVVVVNLLGAIGSSGGITGAVANTVTAMVFVCIPSLVYKYKKGLKWVVLVLFACVLLQCAVALPMNRYVTFYIYHISNPAGLFAEVWWCILLFNFIKGVSNGLITILLYKRLKNLLGKFL